MRKVVVQACMALILKKKLEKFSNISRYCFDITSQSPITLNLALTVRIGDVQKPKITQIVQPQVRIHKNVCQQRAFPRDRQLP